MKPILISVIDEKSKTPVFHERVNIAHIVETRKHKDIDLLIAVLVTGRKKVISQSDLMEHATFHVSEFTITRDK